MSFLFDRFGTETSTVTTATNGIIEKTSTDSEMILENNNQNKNHRNEHDTLSMKNVLTEQHNMDNRGLMDFISWPLGSSHSVWKEHGEGVPDINLNETAQIDPYYY